MKVESLRIRTVGVLTYDLEDFAVSFVSRLSSHLGKGYHVRAYPVLKEVTGNISIDYFPSKQKLKYFSISAPGVTPEGMMSNINIRSAISLALKNDIVILYGLHGTTAIITAIIGKVLGKKVISVNQTVPPYIELKRRWWIKLFKRLLYRCCTCHVVQTPVSINTLTEIYGIRPNKLYYAPFEAGASIFRARTEKLTVPSNKDQNKEKIEFLFVGTILRLKGIEDIIKASKNLAAYYSRDFIVRLVGPEFHGDDKELDYEKIKKTIRTSQLEDNVILEGRKDLDQLIPYYDKADVFILPTYKDCWPKVLVEAAIMSLPIITTSACGASGLLVKDNINGFIIRPGDWIGLSNAMYALFNYDLRMRLSRNSLSIVDGFINPMREVEAFKQAIENDCQL